MITAAVIGATYLMAAVVTFGILVTPHGKFMSRTMTGSHNDAEGRLIISESEERRIQRGYERRRCFNWTLILLGQIGLALVAIIMLVAYCGTAIYWVREWVNHKLT